ncbi:TetR/AcrR family transcriptional regulator [Streptosporangium sp. 'caverna']|uniref:TetR/AcrR family transcriptional regulator n=1 Tax=Streptosporangium sp. 'caverna' TaxID=2202249 RepID=UPI000D7D9AC1|nr:TetR/AcrR family transcriptional regulator [Streptosporangium sp. 'caverna']AWS41837.1 TetR family transcriptional regulator [Streptosporangium sp. 'caverna']
MPKQVDREARRRQIAEALHRILDRDGLEAVSLRDVAAEAGVSMGMVQHYFKNKDQMLYFALEHLHARITRRIAARADFGSPRDLIRSGMIEMLPLDDERRTEARIAMAFLGRSVVAPSLATLLREAYPHIIAFWAGQLRTAQETGQVPGDLDPEREAMILYALTQGLVSPTLIDCYPAELVEATVDYHLDRLFRQGR